MEFLILLFILAIPVFAFLVWLFWIVFGIYAAKTAFDAAAQAQQEMDQLLIDLDRELQNAAATKWQAGNANPGVGEFPPPEQAQIQSAMWKLNDQLAQLDSLSRQRYDTRVAELTGIAASAGISWTPPSY